MAKEARTVTGKDIDDILDEIYTRNPTSSDEDSSPNWKEIIKHIQFGNVNYIHNLLASYAIDVNLQNPKDGKTLLMYAISFSVMN